MIRYFDSSAVLARLLGQDPDPEVAELWRSSSKRLASNLLIVECLVGIRRAAILHGVSIDAPWVRSRIAAADQAFAEVSFKPMDQSIEQIVRKTPSLAECRTLDAIHIATALYFKSLVDGALEIVTLDRSMKAVAHKLGFAVNPAEAT